MLGGHVRLGGKRVKAAKEVRVGDTIEIRRNELRWTVVVSALADRRGPARVAATLYRETPDSIEARASQLAERRLARPVGADLSGRPTKQARRRLEALRHGSQRH